MISTKVVYYIRIKTIGQRSNVSAYKIFILKFNGINKSSIDEM